MAGLRDGSVVIDLQNEQYGARAPAWQLSDLQLVAHHYNHLAVARYLEKNLDEALVAIDYSRALFPNNPSFLNNRGTILAKQGEPLLALAEVAHAVELDPEVPVFRYHLGNLYLVTGQLEEALAHLHYALRLRPNYALARRDLGWALLLSGRITEAGVELERAEREGAPAGALFLALFFASQNQIGKARALIDAHRGDEIMQKLELVLDGSEHGHLREVLDAVRRRQPLLPHGGNPGGQ